MPILACLIHLTCGYADGRVISTFTQPTRLRSRQSAGDLEKTARLSTHPRHCDKETSMQAPDLRGLVPAPVTPFTRDGAVDYAAIQRLGSWLGGIDGVKGLTVLGHAGEGTFLERDE